MVLFLLVVLIMSSLGVAMLLYAKHWELSTGTVILEQTRPRFNTFFQTGLQFIEHRLPHLLREWAIIAVLKTKLLLREGIARTVLVVELGLERVLHTLRHTTSPDHKIGEASAFLREVAEHKQQLAAKIRSRKE